MAALESPRTISPAVHGTATCLMLQPTAQPQIYSAAMMRKVPAKMSTGRAMYLLMEHRPSRWSARWLQPSMEILPPPIGLSRCWAAVAGAQITTSDSAPGLSQVHAHPQLHLLRLQLQASTCPWAWPHLHSRGENILGFSQRCCKAQQDAASNETLSSLSTLQGTRGNRRFGTVSSHMVQLGSKHWHQDLA